MPILSQSEAKNPRINQLSARWQQVWLLALERQRKLNDALDRLEEVRPCPAAFPEGRWHLTFWGPLTVICAPWPASLEVETHQGEPVLCPLGLPGEKYVGEEMAYNRVDHST